MQLIWDMKRRLYDLVATYTKWCGTKYKNTRRPMDWRNTFEQSFNSVKPNDGIFTTLPNDEYVFTLHAIDLITKRVLKQLT